MIIIGIVLLIIALTTLGIVIYGGTDADTVRLEAFGQILETSPLALFLAGAAALLLALLGLLAIRAGARRAARRRAEITRLRRVEAEAQARQAEEAQRRAELDQQRAAGAEREAAAQQAATASTATTTTPVASQSTEETTVLHKEPVVSDTPFGREPAEDTVVTRPGPDSSSSGASVAGTGAGKDTRPDTEHKDSGRL